MRWTLNIGVLISGLLLSAVASAAAAQEGDPAALASWWNALGKFDQDKPAEPPKPQDKQATGQQSPIEDRGALNNNQDPAPRPDNLTLDPKFRGFIPVPNTPVMIKFNAKPHLDMTYDNRNAGDDNRFITAKIPVSTEAAYGGGGVFNINAKASQLSIDVQAPEVDGSPRFYYQNDFYGSGGGEFSYRIQQLYGKIYNIVVGMTYSVFEDPDAWPDTVDYEGPNSMVFARRPLVRYILPLDPSWQLNFGIEQPGSEVDSSVDPTGSDINHAPDFAANVRWEEANVGHMQFSGVLRELGFKGPVTGNQRIVGWGLSLATGVSISKMDSLQALATYGEGIFRYMNDDFFNNDAAFDSNGKLKAIPCAAFMVGFTHRWSDEWRSTASYGYVHLDNEFSQAPTAYHKTQYASANAVWQIRKRLSIGFEALYGGKEDNAGNHGDVFRLQVGLLYSLF